MGSEGVRLSSGQKGGSSLRWSLRGGVSYRLYAAEQRPLVSFCVSTESAEAVVVLDGEMTLEMGAQRQSIALRAGEVGRLARSTPHVFSVSRGTRFVVFDLASSATPTSSEPGDPALFVLSRATAARLSALADRLWERETQVRIEELHEATVDAAGKSCVGRAFEIEAVQHTRLMHRVRAHLEACVAEELSMSVVARRFGVDPFYLSRAFKRDFGVPPAAYLQFLRTERFIWNVLRVAGRRRPRLTTEASLAGFGDYATFSKRIRARFGKAPSELIERF